MGYILGLCFIFLTSEKILSRSPCIVQMTQRLRGFYKEDSIICQINGGRESSTIDVSLIDVIFDASRAQLCM